MKRQDNRLRWIVKSLMTFGFVWALAVLGGLYGAITYAQTLDARAAVKHLMSTTGELHWAQGKSSLSQYSIVEDLSTSHRAQVLLDSGGESLKEFTRLDDIPSQVGPSLASKALEQVARERAASVLSPDYSLDTLIARSVPQSFGPVTLVHLYAESDGIRIPPWICVVITNDGKTVWSLKVSEEPIPGLHIGDVKYTADEAGALAVPEAIRRVAALTGLSEAKVREKGGYVLQWTSPLYYSNSPLGYCGLPTPGAFYGARVARTKSPEAGKSDGLPQEVSLIVDANTGKTAVPPGIAGQMPSVADKSAQPLVAYALAALAGLLVVFLVVKLRKR